MSLVIPVKSETAISTRDAAFGSLVAKAFRRIVRWRKQARAARELSRYPDALLKDMGIARSEIRGAVRYGRDGIFDVDVGNSVR
ncbi:MAG TPA: DUF1127 domain-containing protein [Bauldia sp.]|nr:DUF1127 domain-containing protein [Bauldia sp.]